MSEEQQPQQDTTAAVEPAQQSSIPSPPQPTEPVTVSEPAIQVPVEPALTTENVAEPPVAQPEPGTSNNLATKPSEEEMKPTTVEPAPSAPEQPTTPTEPESSVVSTTPPSSPTTAPVNPEPAPAQQEPQIIERVRELNESEQEELFKTKLKSLSPKGVSARRGKRQANYDKIIAHLKIHGYIANNEVETLCRVKDSTARKYLNDLEKQGILLQIGSRGRRVRYRLTQGNQ